MTIKSIGEIVERLDRNDFDRLFDEWAKADRECARLYLLWDEACQHRRRLAVAKNEAWRNMTESA